MDFVWLIVDSLSFSATPFAADGPETMPKLESLAGENGVVFERAYTPGHLSMSAHGSLFTGKLPSETGMHEAHPQFDSHVSTVADIFNETHQTHLITPNPWLLHGLEGGFDTVEHFLNPYLLFSDATDPYQFMRTTDVDSPLRRYWDFVWSEGKPVRSLLNGVAYKAGFGLRSRDHMLLSRVGDDRNYQYAETIGKKIRRKLEETGDAAVVANFMDVHPPFTASESALEAVAPERDVSEFPIGADAEQTRPVGEKSYDLDRMVDLYRASIVDLDRKLAPLISELIDRGTATVVTADHGSFFQHQSTSDGQLRVPLLMFLPDEEPRTVPYSVPTRGILRTFAEACRDGDGRDLPPGPSLLDVSDHQTVLSEVITATDIPDNQVVPKDPSENHDIRRDVVAHHGTDRIAYEGGDWSSDGPEQLREVVQNHLSGAVAPVREGAMDYGEGVQSQLENLGYV